MTKLYIDRDYGKVLIQGPPKFKTYRMTKVAQDRWLFGTRTLEDRDLILAILKKIGVSAIILGSNLPTTKEVKPSDLLKGFIWSTGISAKFKDSAKRTVIRELKKNGYIIPKIKKNDSTS